MKKSIFIVAALAAFTFASCKKDYKCDCKLSNGSAGVEYTIHTTKKKADAACKANETTGYTCELGND